MAIENYPYQEIPRRTHEQNLTDLHDILIDVRTVMKAQLKSKGRVSRYMRRQFYEIFITFYGYVYPQLDVKEHKDLILKINNWDKAFEIRGSASATDGILEGIKLSQQLQAACRQDGIIGGRGHGG